jgi:hypothetical protein
VTQEVHCEYNVTVLTPELQVRFTERVEELQKQGLHILVTTTPRLEGRSFGTNVMEATLLAMMGKPQSEITTGDFLDLIERIPLQPNIEVLN